MGSPALDDDRTIDTRFGPQLKVSDPGTPQLAPGALGHADVDGLPTGVEALDALIQAQAAANGGGATDAEVFTIVGDLLGETVASPHLGAALYRVAARIGGVELEASMTDHAGRTGLAVSLVGDHPGRGRQRLVLVFDPDTSMLLEQETIQLSDLPESGASTPVSIGYTTYLTSEIIPVIP